MIETKNIVLYSLEMSLVAHEYEMLHVEEPGKKPVWKYYPKDGQPQQVMRFDGTKATPVFMQALNYLDHFWDGLFLYRKDGSYPMDNNLAERSVRPFTTKRKCSLHFGSDEGVEMSAVYHSIISTLKLCG